MSELLPSHQKSTFMLLAEILAQHGPQDRDALRVLMASHGGQLGRDYVRFRELGLIEEVHSRPGFLRRLFGAKTLLVVSLTEKGRDFVQASKGQGAHQTMPLAAAAAEAPHQETETPSVEGLATASDVQPSVRDEEVAAPQVTSVAVSEVLPQPTTEPPLSLVTRAPKRFALGDYTDVLGGVADDTPVLLSEDERLGGLAELLGLLGLEITPAGELLAGRRWSEGHADADIALEIAVVAVAHAARLNHTGTATLAKDAMLAQIDGIIGALGSLVREGQLTDEQISESLHAMRMFVNGDDEALAGIDALLSDPLRGMAPSAIFPDEVWVREADEEFEA